MQKTLTVLTVAVLNLFFLQTCSAEMITSPSPPASSAVKLRKFLTLALLLSESKYTKKKAMHYFPLHPKKTNKKIAKP